jgi:hypothetical protein
MTRRGWPSTLLQTLVVVPEMVVYISTGMAETSGPASVMPSGSTLGTNGTSPQASTAGGGSVVDVVSTGGRGTLVGAASVESEPAPLQAERSTTPASNPAADLTG